MLTEVFDLEDPNAVCSVSPQYFHHSLRFATSGLLSERELVICGGYKGGSETDECWTLGSTAEFATLDNPRTDTASIVLDAGQTLWITGGHSFGSTLRTTEMVSASGIVSSGPNLPEQREDHCLVKINVTTAMLIGGSDSGGSGGEISTKTWFYHIRSGQWRNGPELSTGRIIQSCGLLNDKGNGHRIVVVTGGWRAFYQTTGSTELLDLDSDGPLQWDVGPSLPQAVDRAPSVVAKGGTSFIVVGGLSSSSYHTDNLQELQCQNGDCTWTVLDQSLNVPRCCGVAVMVPNSMVTCQESNPSKSILIQLARVHIHFFSPRPFDGRQKIQ